MPSKQSSWSKNIVGRKSLNDVICVACLQFAPEMTVSIEEKGFDTTIVIEEDQVTKIRMLPIEAERLVDMLNILIGICEVR